ncbi:MAG: hypothetical protein ACYTGP_01035 [Planctomycetota bacterium]|jgi:hypothetical protein
MRTEDGAGEMRMGARRVAFALTMAGSAVISSAVSAGPVPCSLDPPCTGVPEGEPCDEVGEDTTNGGCNSTPEAFGTITIDGPQVCGVAWANAGDRDTDWYAFSTTVLRQVTIEIRGELDVASFLATMSAGGACPVTGIPNGTVAFSGDCDTIHDVGTGYTLDPGDYILFVAPGTETGGGVFDGFPCPTGDAMNNLYEVELRTGFFPAFGACCTDAEYCIGGISQSSCESLGYVYYPDVTCAEVVCTGACCIESICSDLLFAECIALGGAYQGPNTFCADVTCPAGACCLPNGTCRDGLTAIQCASIGAYQGDETLCSGVSCAPCPADLNGNDFVDFADILAIIGAWGPCVACPEDLDGSGDVGFGDVLVVIGAWGACP